MLSTLDWSLIAMWQEAGFPLEAVLAGIDATFEKYAARQAKGASSASTGWPFARRRSSAPWKTCMKQRPCALRKQASAPEETGFEASRIAAFSRANAEAVKECASPEKARETYRVTSHRLESIAAIARKPCRYFYRIARTTAAGTGGSVVRGVACVHAARKLCWAA